MIWLEFAITGIIAGFLAGYLGIGGGLVLVPALTLLLSRNPALAQHAVHMAVATSLATMLLASLSSILAHHRRGAIQWAQTRQLAPGLLLGAVGGAMIADRLSAGALAAVFGVFALLVGLHLLTGREAHSHGRAPGRWLNGLAGLLFGAISSLVGIGGGSMTVPWFLHHGVRARQAVGTAASCGYPIAIAGSISFAWLGRDVAPPGSSLGYIYLPAFAGIAVFSILAAPLGAAAVHRTPPELVRRLFGGFLVLVAIRIFSGWPG
jgi:uncharacterized membrane protein YfcA